MVVPDVGTIAYEGGDLHLSASRRLIQRFASRSNLWFVGSGVVLMRPNSHTTSERAVQSLSVALRAWHVG